MAGKFLSLEEAARHLGVTVDEINRLVDRKKLFPMRDGTLVKFKADDIDRVARDLGDDTSQSEDLSLDLDLPVAGGSGASGDLAISYPIETDDSIFAADAGDAPPGSQTIVRGGAAASGVDISLDAAGASALDSDDLALESIIGASSPSLAVPAADGSLAGGSAVGGDATLAIDLSDALKGSAPLGSQAAGSAPSMAGSALSAALDSGLSLEDGDIKLSGIDVAGGSFVATDGGSGLGGEDFQLGEAGGDEDSASVVIATEESGDSSFFGAAMDAEGSSISEEALGTGSASVSIAGEPGELSFEMPFSGLQIAGLVCCSLLLLGGGFVMFDLVRTIGSPDGPTLANPLLDSLAETFGWR